MWTCPYKSGSPGSQAFGLGMEPQHCFHGSAAWGQQVLELLSFHNLGIVSQFLVMRLTRNWFCLSRGHWLTHSLMADYTLDIFDTWFCRLSDLTWACPSPLLWLGFITHPFKDPLIKSSSPSFPGLPSAAAPLSPVLCQPNHSFLSPWSSATGRYLGKLHHHGRLVPLHIYEPFSLCGAATATQSSFNSLVDLLSLSFSGCPWPPFTPPNPPPLPSPLRGSWGSEVMEALRDDLSHGCPLGLLNSSMRTCLSHFSHVWLIATPWTVLHQSPLSMGFSRQEYWSGLSCPPPGDLHDPRIEPTFLMSPALPGGFFTTSAIWKTQIHLYFLPIFASFMVLFEGVLTHH